MENMNMTPVARGSKLGPVLMGLVLGIVVGAGGYWWFQQMQPKTTTTPMVASSTTPASTTTTTRPATISSTTTGWKTYTDPSVGFSFLYPPDATQTSTQGLTYDITVNKLSSYQDGPNGGDKATAEADKTALAKGDPTTRINWPVAGSYQLLTIPGATAKSITQLSATEACDVQLSRIAYIYKGDYQIILDWGYNINNGDIQKNNQSYFETTSTCGTTPAFKRSGNDDLTAMNQLYTDLVARKTDSVSQAWFTDFDTIMQTFQFTK